MKKFTSVVSIFAFAVALSVCQSSNAAEDVTVTAPADANVSRQLDLQALSALAKQAHNASEFERLLNEEGSLNNLDLDGDGYVDYIRVEEYKTENVRGFALLDGEQEVARVEVDHTLYGVDNVVIEGNPVVYEEGGGYWNWDAPRGEYPLFSWLWMPRAWFYISPWHSGFYPGWYRHYRPASERDYAWRTRGYRDPRMDTRRYLGYNRGPSHGQWRNDRHSHPEQVKPRRMNQPNRPLFRNSPPSSKHPPQLRSQSFPQQRHGVSSPPRSTYQAPHGAGQPGGNNSSGYKGKH